MSVTPAPHQVGFHEALLRRPFASAAALSIGGILLHAHLPHRPRLYVTTVIILALVGLVPRLRRVGPIGLGVALFLAGLAAAQLESSCYPRHHIGQFAEELPRLVRLQLRIDSTPRVSTGVFGQRRQIAHATVVSILTQDGWQHASGTTLLRLAEPHPQLAISQRVEAFGLLQRPLGAANPGQFDWASYCREQRILTAMHVPHAENIRILKDPGPGMLDSLRMRVRQLLAMGFASSASTDQALLQALVLGDVDPQLRDIQDEFVRTGTSHHLAISGMHVAILGALVFGFCRLLLLPPRPATWIGLVCIILYGLVVLPSPPVVRSVLLCAALAAGILCRRTLDPIHLLALSVLAMLAYHPLDLYSAGFQLSFGTVLGLMLCTRPAMQMLAALRDRDVEIAAQLQRRTGLQRAPHWLRRWIAATLVAGIVAWLVSAPLIAYHFNQLNPWAIPGSILLATPVFLSLVAGLLKIILTLLMPFAAGPLAWAAALPVALMRDCVEWLARLPGADWPMPAPSMGRIVACYVLLAMPLALRLRRTASPAATTHPTPQPRAASFSLLLFPAASLAALLVPLLPFPPHRDAGQLRLSLLAVGAGQCAVVQLPCGQTLLIDAGSAAMSDPARECLIPCLKHLGIRRVDRVFISHANYDHWSALGGVIARSVPDRIHITPVFRQHAELGPGARELAGILRDLPDRVQTLSAGQRLSLDGKTTLEVLWPPEDAALDPNNSSLVLRLRYGGCSILFPGDIQEEAMRRLLGSATNLRSDILIAPHHGSSEPTTAAFLEAAAPAIVLASNGQRLSRKQIAFDALVGTTPLYRTSRDGAITVTISKAGQIALETFTSHKTWTGGR